MCYLFTDSAPVEIPHSGMRKQRKGALTKKDRDELEALKGGEGMVCGVRNVVRVRCFCL